MLRKTYENKQTKSRRSDLRVVQLFEQRKAVVGPVQDIGTRHTITLLSPNSLSKPDVSCGNNNNNIRFRITGHARTPDFPRVSWAPAADYTVTV